MLAGLGWASPLRAVRHRLSKATAVHPSVQVHVVQVRDVDKVVQAFILH